MSGLLVRMLAGLGFLFLYLPIAALVAYSFNASERVTVWTGLSLRWYRALAENRQILEAALVSLQVAALSASLAALLGTAAGVVLARHGRFAGRSLFAGLVATPLVLPEVLTGLSLLLLFVGLEGLLGWPAGRGIQTIVLAHATFALAYVAVIVQARLSGMDRATEEAAADLGAPPATVFLTVTLPAIWPAVAAGWLLAFTLSLDDLVIASFVSGPGSSTLPMVVFSKIRLGLSRQVNALASLLIAAVAIGAAMVVLLRPLAGRRPAATREDAAP